MTAEAQEALHGTANAMGACAVVLAAAGYGEAAEEVFEESHWLRVQALSDDPMLVAYIGGAAKGRLHGLLRVIDGLKLDVARADRTG